MTVIEKYTKYLEEIRKALVQLIATHFIRCENDVEEYVYRVIELKEARYKNYTDWKLRKTPWRNLDLSRIICVITDADNMLRLNNFIDYHESTFSKLRDVRNFVAHEQLPTLTYEKQLTFWKILKEASETLHLDIITDCINIELNGTINRSKNSSKIRQDLLNLLEERVMTPAYNQADENTPNGKIIKEKIDHTRNYLSKMKSVDEVHDFYWNSLKNPSGIEAYDAIKEQKGNTFEDCRKEFMAIYGETLPKQLKFL